MGFSPFNSEFDAISGNPPGHGVSHHLTKCRALPFNALPGTLGSDPAKDWLKATGSSGIHKTNPMELRLCGNIAHLLSLLARAMQTREETIP
jgi:hypothetical protein